MSTALISALDIQGYVSRLFEPVRKAFAENFARRGEWGGACCAFYRGEKVVDLWAVFGTSEPRNRGSRTPWWSSTQPPRVWPR